MDRKTKLISAASVIGIVLAGSTAVAANVGILGQADAGGLGELSVVADPGSLEPQVIDIQLDPQAQPSATASPVGSQTPTPDASPSPSPINGQPFVVEDAGVVTVASEPTGLRIVEVSPSDGWRYVNNDAPAGTVSVTFDSDAATYVFTASVQADGSVLANVEQPIVQFVPGPTPVSPSPSSTPRSSDYDDDDDYDDHDDDHRDDDHDDDDHDDDDHDDDDHDDDDDDDHDDDDDEHEGGDDDD